MKVVIETSLDEINNIRKDRGQFVKITENNKDLFEENFIDKVTTYFDLDDIDISVKWSEK
ncbi:MAG TPA: hypothetical protein ENI36_01455 [Thermoplasmatales archaeon]|nr:hypothetical protein [Thermoplasmatales archaeon]